jgi:hypothetical protein
MFVKNVTHHYYNIRETRSDTSQQENQINANSNNDNSGMDAEILEQGYIYFFYQPKKGAEEFGLQSTFNQGSRANTRIGLFPESAT